MVENTGIIGTVYTCSGGGKGRKLEAETVSPNLGVPQKGMVVYHRHDLVSISAFLDNVEPL